MCTHAQIADFRAPRAPLTAGFARFTDIFAGTILALRSVWFEKWV
jgi:hypothetical protein